MACRDNSHDPEEGLWLVEVGKLSRTKCQNLFCLKMHFTTEKSANILERLKVQS